METGMFINYVLGLLLRKIYVPTDFHGQADVIKEMQKNDVSGLVDSLTDFSVNSASVDFSIESDDEKFNKILHRWLDEINKDFKGKIPSGIKSLAKEYFKERWKGSSFPVLKISKWDTIEGIKVPVKAYFVDGGSIYAKDLTEGEEELKLINYDYYIGRGFKNKNKLGDNTLFARPYGRWFDKYPVPYLIKRGVYHNWKIIESLKSKETEILDQIIPYLLLIKKGTSEMALQKDNTYSDKELKAVIKEFQNLIDKMKTTSTTSAENIGTKTPIRATNFDEEIKHLIPDLAGIFDPALFTVAEQNILAGLGFIDVVEAVSTSRRESILNPKVFIEEVKTGVEDFKQLLKEMVLLIKSKNENNKKYMNAEFYITSSPVRSFITDDFKDKIRQLFDRGKLSMQTYVELTGEVDFRTEVHRRKQETAQGLDLEMYPHLRENREGVGIDFPEEEIDKDNIPDDKRDKIEKKNYDIGMEYPIECPSCENVFDYYAEAELNVGIVECPKCGSKVISKKIMETAKAENEEAEKYIQASLRKAKVFNTKRYIRIRQKEPRLFQKKHFKTITLSESQGIKAIISRLKGQKTTTIQSYLFDRKKWTVKKAQAWVKQHKKSKSELEIAPYRTIRELPKPVKNSLDADLQRVWMRAFNGAYDTYHNDTMASRVAWSVIKKIARKGKDGKWHRKRTRIKGKLQKIQLTRAMVEKILEKEEKQTIEETIGLKKLENEGKKGKLLDQILNKKKE